MSRPALLKKLGEETFDVLVVGGGATGAGAALDAASRGLKTALVERSDFASGTSSRSTKLIHGGVRYLEQAILKFDRSQFHLVREALHERKTLLRNAPHLTRALGILTPLYNRFEVPYYRTGLRLYDRLAGKACLRKSHFMGAAQAKAHFPLLNAEGLKGGVIYYDGQFDDARMNVALALSAARLGAVVLNHVEVIGLAKDRGRVSGAVVRDAASAQRLAVRARVVVNAAGPFADTLRLLDDPKATPILRASSGVHVILDSRFRMGETGLLIPKTEDGRVLFMLPWLGHCLVGTTDHPAEVTENPKATEEEIQEILKEVSGYLSTPATRADVRAAWCGLRPLVSPQAGGSTARISRDHHLERSTSGLVTIAGGKWTTYRRMAEDTIDEAIRWGGLLPLYPSRTDRLKLVGADGYHHDESSRLVERYHIPDDIASHLAHAYGDRAGKILEQAKPGRFRRLVDGHPYLEAELTYAAEHELAETLVDVLARRLRLTFLDTEGAKRVLPRAAEILGLSLGWDEARRHREIDQTLAYLP